MDFASGTNSVRLCRDCKYRPIEFGRPQMKPETPACTLNPDLDAIDARETCNGEFWERGR